jgi:signal transduction histidine kinase
MVVRELAAPLRSLARVADLIGGPGMVLVQEAGPGEVRRVARTLNAMQARIHKLIEDRTLALAAVSHDLRTPIARLRLQADFVADQESRGAMIESLDDMEHMVASVLTYLAGETDTELPRPVDLALLLMTQTDAAADAGEHVRYEGEEHARAFVRAIHMKRAFANLIGNAVKYGGGGVVVRLQASPTSFIVQVDDNGPGIPPASLERALEPFCRLEPSRGQNSGSVGLGLSIVQQAVQREGGTFALSNRAEGGLRAEIVLPRTQ